MFSGQAAPAPDLPPALCVPAAFSLWTHMNTLLETHMRGVLQCVRRERKAFQVPPRFSLGPLL